MKILVVAGEASADLHAGHLLEQLAKKNQLQLVGIGGDALQKLGLHPIKTPKDMAVVGLTEALRKIPQTFQLLSELEQIAKEQKPDFALLLDLPDFNLRLAKKMKALQIPVIYYISPQVWAWRKNRVFQMANCIDLLLSILPFEKPWFEKNAPKELNVEYVGHPAIQEIPELPYEPQENHIVLMPGSRESEWKNLFQDMVEAAALLHRAKPEMRFSLPLANALKDSTIVKEFLSLQGPVVDALQSLGASLSVVQKPAYECLRTAKAAWIASGTATLEAAIVGTPMIVLYRVSPITGFLFRNIIRYSGPIAMVNLIHGGLGTKNYVVPEILQNDISPENLASAMRNILQEPNWTNIKNTLSRTRALLSGTSLPIDNAAQSILHFMEKKNDFSNSRLGL